MALLHEKSVRGRTQTGWLDSFHTFSFGSFNDPRRPGYRALRVINEDRVIGGAGFSTHRHADMDILTLVISGALRHEDSLGNGSIIRPGEIQRMSAGTGIRHSEMNASAEETVHFLQIWIVPETVGGEPSYEQESIDQTGIEDQFGLVAGPSTEEALVSLNSDTRVYLANLSDETVVEHRFSTGRAGFIHIVDGMVKIEEERLTAGDGLQFGDQEICTVIALSDAKVILFDLA